VRDRDTAQAAVRLAVAVKRLRSRMREESGLTSAGLPVSQLSVVSRLMTGGPATAAALAAAEHVSHQAVTQSVAGLKAAGMVSAAPDPADGRKILISLTDAGRGMIESALSSRDEWLTRAIESAVSPGERAALDKAIDLLERLAEAEPGRPAGMTSRVFQH
jgi:DNA-binding MarR family transcriptional regulator